MRAMVSAPEDLQVRSARQRSAHAHNQFARQRFRHRHTLDANIFPTVEDCGLHGCRHQVPPTLLRPREQAQA